MNFQPIEKRLHCPDGTLQVHSVFRTIQGEGPFCGTPCVFVRLAGCNLQCPACDTDYTSTRAIMSPRAILDKVLELWCREKRVAPGLVVITGGEPFRQNLAPLLLQLQFEGFFVQIESNGTLRPTPITYNLNTHERQGVYLVVSPKTGKVHRRVYHDACALKYVIEHGQVREEDGLPLRALDHTANPYPARPPHYWPRPVYVQPMDEHDPVKNRLHLQAALESSMTYGYILQLQIHKILGVE